MALAAAPARDEVEPPSKPLPAYVNRPGEFLLIAILISATIAGIYLSWRWPMILDGPVLQYCAFLIDHGKVPYRDIVDANGLGAYFSSWLEIHLFGYSDLGWRVYDLLFLLLGSVGIAFICKPFGKVGTIVGSCLLAMTHIMLGPREIGERDFQMVVLELVAAGFMLQGFRDHRRHWFLASGALGFLGGTIKPTGFVILVAFVAQAIVVTRQQNRTRLAKPLSMILGAAVPCALAAAYLLYAGAWPSFVEVCRKLLPLYASIRRPKLILWGVLTSHLEAFRLLVVVSGLLLVCKKNTWLTRESVAVLLGFGSAFACFWIQGKGYSYHVAPVTAFLGVWCGLAIAVLMKDRRVLVRAPLALTLAFWVLSWVPGFVSVPLIFRRTYSNSLEAADLRRLEAQIANLRSSGKAKGIQVMDTSFGAIHALYDLRLVQSSGFIYDFYFYSPPGNPYIHDLRARFMEQMAAARPDLLVVSAQSWPDPQFEYKRMDQWPELGAFLQSNYELKTELSQYRIYVHR